MTEEELDAEDEILLAKAAYDVARLEHLKATSAMRQARRWYVSAYEADYLKRAKELSHSQLELREWIELLRPLCHDCLMVIKADDHWHDMTLESGRVGPSFSCNGGRPLD